MAGISERNRLRVAGALIVLSVVLILLGFAIIISQDTEAPPARVTTWHVKAVPAPREQASTMKQVLFLVVVLILIFVVSSLAFLRWSRGFRRWVFHKPHSPTPSEDVWAMHKLPDGALKEWEDDGGPPNDTTDQPDNP